MSTIKILSAIAVLIISFGTKPDRVYCQEMILVRGTLFERGADVSGNVYQSGSNSWSGPDWDEGPRHDVTVSAFKIGKHQVTQSQFSKFMKDYRQRLNKQGIEFEGDSPAVFVSWDEANEYCKWLATQTKNPVRLPSEAEWELAASNANILGLSGFNDGVQEWCIDWFACYPKNGFPLVDPGGPEKGYVHSIRDGGGGSVEEIGATGDIVIDYRITDRSASVSGDRRANLGFRIAMGGSLNFEKEKAARIVDSPSDKCEWIEQIVDQPYFWSGGNVIDESDISPETPYWNRHHAPSLTWCDNGDLLRLFYGSIRQ
ncbi:MAG: formylglycine-generating enzyme family protein [Pirellulaceae bacterium]